MIAAPPKVQLLDLRRTATGTMQEVGCRIGVLELHLEQAYGTFDRLLVVKRRRREWRESLVVNLQIRP